MPRKRDSRKGQLCCQSRIRRLPFTCGIAAQNRCSIGRDKGVPVTKLVLSQNSDGFWTVSTAGLVVTGLRRHEAEAFIASYERCSARSELLTSSRCSCR